MDSSQAGGNTSSPRTRKRAISLSSVSGAQRPAAHRDDSRQEHVERDRFSVGHEVVGGFFDGWTEGVAKVGETPEAGFEEVRLQFGHHQVLGAEGDAPGPLRRVLEGALHEPRGVALDPLEKDAIADEPELDDFGEAVGELGCAEAFSTGRDR